MSKKDLGFALNYTNVHAIDITPNAADHTWAYIGQGIQSITPSPNETVDTTYYYNGGGQASSDTTGVDATVSFSGHRYYGDPAQDYIAALDYIFGEARKTYYRHVAPDGRVLEGPCSITNIVNGGGDANGKGTFSFDIKWDGVPTVKDPDYASMPTGITATAVTVAEGAVEEIGATVAPEGASAVCQYAIDDPDIAIVTADGKVKGVKAGETELTIKSALAPTIGATVKVTVTAAATGASSKAPAKQAV